jgi:3-carboxy-cis,cis-muconate cycloisomerase
VVSACGLFTGMLGKTARDIALLMQTEIAEVSEPGGASSTMPQKRNPAGCAIALAAASRLPGLVSSAMNGLVQEHERGLGTWHAQWPIVAEALQLTAAALRAMREVADRLEVYPDRMRANIDATHGAIVAERVMMRVAPVLGRDRAHDLLRQALERARSGHESLSHAVRGVPELAALLSDDECASLDDPRTYLGAAELFRRRLLED